MFFKESENLLQTHPKIFEAIDKLDSLLSQFTAESVVRPSDYVVFLKAELYTVNLLLEEYKFLGVLNSTEMVECEKCQTIFSATEYDQAVFGGDELICSFCGDNICVQSPRRFKVYRLTRTALHEVERNRTIPKKEVNHLVLLLHGIRTEATWQEMVAAELNLLDGVEAQPIGFGVFDTFRFWCPIFTRGFALRNIRRKIRHARNYHERSQISVIAHSFGTYAIFKLLNDSAEFKFF